MNEELIASLMSGFGVKFISLRRGSGIPVRMAQMMTSCSPADGRSDWVVQRDDPDRVAKFNIAWYEMATEFKLFSADRHFLVGVGADIDPDFAQAREEADDWEDPAWWESVWALVELQDGWDIAGAGAASGVLGSGYGYPGFVMSAVDGSVFLVGTVWQYSIGLAVLPKPYCAPTLQDLARRNLGSLTPTGNQDIVAFLERGGECE